MQNKWDLLIILYESIIAKKLATFTYISDYFLVDNTFGTNHFVLSS